MSVGRKFLYGLITVLVLFSFTVTALVGTLFVSNFAGLGDLVQVGALIKTQYLEEVETEVLLQGAVRGMVNELGDRYSEYLDQEDFAELTQHIQGVFGGIGIYVTQRKEDEKIVVAEPIDGSPADKAGIKQGDLIVKIDETSLEGYTLEEAVKLMRGEPGTKVKVGILRPGVNDIKEFSLNREVIDVPTVVGEMLKEAPEIAYIRVRMFASNSDEQLAKVISDLEKKNFKALILDLRYNPGGDLDTAVNIAQYFVPKGPVVYTQTRNGEMKVYGESKGTNLKVPVAVLINDGSASASEVLAGAIKDTKAGILIGTTTFGKGVVQSVFLLGEDSGMKLTTSRYLTPNKIDINKKGIEPDIKVELPLPTSKDAIIKDTQLEKAIEVVRSQIVK